MTTSETNDRAALKLHYANKDRTSSKTFEKAYSIIFTDLTTNHKNLDYLEQRFLNWGKFTSGGKFPSFRG